MNTYAKYHQSEEDYLESILEISKEGKIVHRIDIAKRMDVSQAAVNKAVKLLCEKGYVYEEGKHLCLTVEGKRYAEEVFERHCILREFLKGLGVSEEVAEEDACRMEHVISDVTYQAIKRYILDRDTE